MLYLANIRLPTEKAHGAQIMKSCESFVCAGQQLELVVPRRKTPIKDDPFSYYGVERSFAVRSLPTLDTVRWWGKLGFLIQTISFAIPAALYARKPMSGVVYTRDEVVAATALLLGVKQVVWESHDGAWNQAARFVARRAWRMVVVTQGAEDFYVSRGVAREKIAVIPNGVDTDAFTRSESRSASRERLGIPRETTVALYVGALDGWKGTDVLLEASRQLEDATIVVIGGAPERIKKLREQYPRVLFLGSQPYRLLADNLAAADICVLPNTARDPVSVTFTCPLKLLAYMASGKPIVASDLPSVRELTGDDAAFLVASDDPAALAKGIKRLAHDASLRAALGERARKRSLRYDWDIRAERVLSHIAS